MNQAINFFWTILCFIPVIAVWVRSYSGFYLWIVIGISAISLLIPTKWLQLSADPHFYQSLGVRFIRRFVQNGDYAKRHLRSQQRQYKAITTKTRATAYLGTVKMYERYHLYCFTFFLITTFYAVETYQHTLAVVVVISNIIYNILTILLQQYNRARITQLNKRVL